MYFVYILQSESNRKFYVGSCNHLIKRFYEHQFGYVLSTRRRGPWWMPYYEIYPTLKEARAREYEIKRKKSSKSIKAIIYKSMPGIRCL